MQRKIGVERKIPVVAFHCAYCLLLGFVCDNYIKYEQNFLHREADSVIKKAIYDIVVLPHNRYNQIQEAESSRILSRRYEK